MRSDCPHVALIERNDSPGRNVVIVPVDQLSHLDDPGPRTWLEPYLGTEWHFVAFVPVAFLPAEPRRPGSYPDGDPNEAAIKAELDRLGEELVVVITRGDLKRLDAVCAFVESMAQLFSEDMADDMFNLRNGMVPFKDGEAKALGLYEPGADERDD